MYKNRLVLVVILFFFFCQSKKEKDLWTVHREYHFTPPEIINQNDISNIIFTHENIDTTIVLRTKVDTLGNVKVLDIIKSFNNYYDSLAITKVEKFKFRPAKRYTPKYKHGKPVEHEMTFVIYLKHKKWI